jgi:serine/threonine protein kinase
MHADDIKPNPAQQLAGLTLEGGWKVLGFADRKPNATGGHFSQGYIVERADGTKGFLKAMDYMKAFESPNSAEVFQAMSTAYLFEKSVCEKCNRLNRIARAIDAGSHILCKGQPHTKVEYLVFELAERDIRSHMDDLRKLDLLFLMKTLHHVATAISQLHRAGIAHQDLKPSNVLIFAGNVGAKICDLGRAWDKNSQAPHDSHFVAGDRAYAPLELLYRMIPANDARRYGCDLYHLGSLIVFLFTQVHTTALVLRNLDQSNWPNFWGGTYPEALPFVLAAFDLALSEFTSAVPLRFSTHLRRCVAELCNPDPSRRGDPRSLRLNQFSLERYISCFDRLAYMARLALA